MTHSPIYRAHTRLTRAPLVQWRRAASLFSAAAALTVCGVALGYHGVADQSEVSPPLLSADVAAASVPLPTIMFPRTPGGHPDLITALSAELAVRLKEVQVAVQSLPIVVLPALKPGPVQGPLPLPEPVSVSINIAPIDEAPAAEDIAPAPDSPVVVELAPPPSMAAEYTAAQLTIEAAAAPVLDEAPPPPAEDAQPAEAVVEVAAAVAVAEPAPPPANVEPQKRVTVSKPVPPAEKPAKSVTNADQDENTSNKSKTTNNKGGNGGDHNRSNTNAHGNSQGEKGGGDHGGHGD